MNPEQKLLVSSLRTSAKRIESGSFSTTDAFTMRRAADVLEGGKAPDSDTFREAWDGLRTALGNLTDMMDDPFKAPEQSVGLVQPLLEALWQFQIEWVVLNRAA